VVKLADIGANAKLAACIGALAAIVLSAIGCVAIGQAAIDTELKETLAASDVDIRAVEKLYDRFEDVARLRRRLTADGDSQTKSMTIDALHVAAEDGAALFGAAVRSAPRLVTRIDQARGNFARLSHTGDQSTNAVGIDRESAMALADDPGHEWRSLRDEIMLAIRAGSEIATAKARAGRAFLLEVLGAVLAAALGLAFVVLRIGLTAPIRTLASAIHSVPPSSGHAPLPGLDRKDEAGQIARGFDAAKSALATEFRAEADRGGRLRQSEADARVAESRAAADGSAQTLLRLGEAMKTLAAGDLRVRLGGSLAGEGASLARNFDLAVNLLAKTALAFGMSADAVQSKARDISQASHDLTQRGEQQLLNLEKASAALANIATRANDASDGAARARRHATVLDEEAAKSAVRLKQASETWETVAKSAEQVSGMTALVDEVAFRTTLLALNASVEAARAGEVGRGIAVVALEMRALAQRSTQAAREFDAAFSASTAQIRKGAELLAETDASLDRIKQSAAEIQTAASAIGEGESERSKDVREIRGALDRIGAASNQNAKTATDVASGGRSVDELIGKLAELIQHFRLGAPAAKASAEPRVRSRARENAAFPLALQSNSS
jgi:methyl-accepting chemotaxis protein